MNPSIEPFDEGKYKCLMDGLECSEIRLSELERTRRIDAEFYQKGNLQISETLNKMSPQNVASLFQVSDGNHMSIADFFSNEGVPYYRGQDMHCTFIEESAPICIGKDIFKKPAMTRSHLKKGDVLMSIVGTIGSSALVTSDRDATCSCKLAILRSLDMGILPETLFIFIRTAYGQNQIQKLKRGTVQMGFILDDFSQLYIPQFSAEFQEKIKVLCDCSIGHSEQSQKTYKEAENLLLSELGFTDFAPSKEPVSVRNFKDIMGIGRIDAEYYQPKYDELIAEIKLSSNNTVGTGCNIYDNNFIPEKNKMYKYIELSDIGNFGEINGYTYELGSELPTRARRMVHSGNIIIPSVEGSLQNCAIITDDFEGALCSNGFYVIDSDIINSETLLILFKSSPIQALLKQQCTGTILTAFSKDGLLTIPLPFISEKAQRAISDKMQKSFSLQHQSEALIKKAIKAMEIAIEDGEDEAVNFVDITQ